MQNKNFIEDLFKSHFFLKVTLAVIFLLSIFLRSRIDVGGDSAVNIDLAAKIARGGKYYYDFFESNFPLTLWITVIPYFLAKLLNINPLITADFFVNLLGIISLFCSARILAKSTLRQDHQNLLIISFALGFFLRIHALEANEFVTKVSFLLALFFPYLSYSFARKAALTKTDLIWRGTCAGMLCCLKPHYIFLPLLIEIDRFWQKKSLKFFLELDKLVIGAVGLVYLLLMLKFTPEFFEFIIPMSSFVYYVYNDLSYFWKNILHHFSSKIIFFAGFFLVFLKQKFTAEDRILFLVFSAASLIILLENLGSVDQEACFSALTIPVFIKIFYDFTKSKNFDFSRIKIPVILLTVFLIFEPSSILTLTKTTLPWWVIALTIIILGRFRTGTRPLLALVFSLTAFILALAIAIKIATINQNAFMAFSEIAFLIFLFFNQRNKKSFSTPFACAQFILIFSIASYLLTSITSAYRGDYIFKSPDFLSDKIISYSKANLKNDSDQISIWSYFISESFPALTYLGKVNNYLNHTAGVLYANIGDGFFERHSDDKSSKDFVLNYFFNDVKKQIKNKNMKIIFVYKNDPCRIGFLENYFHDKEFKKDFLENYHFAGSFFAIKEIAELRNLDLPIYRLNYDFEIYARKNEE